MDCSICCEKFNKTNHLKIECKTCDEEVESVCRTCAQTFILNSTSDPSCMMCNNIWDKGFMDENLTKTFINTKYKNHRENVLMDRQIALLPATQPFAAQEKKRNEIDKLIHKAGVELYKLNIQAGEQRKLIRELHQTKFDMENNMEDVEEKEVKMFTYKCPIENCNGFLDKKNICGLCETKICKHCMEIKEEGHKCNEDTKVTVALLKKDTKPCPKCGEMIHKINGCDQMYCIKCNTPFSWNTGKIDLGNIHNPEYYRWVRENGGVVPRNPLDVVENNNGCERVLSYRELLGILTGIYNDALENNDKESKNEATQMINIHRMNLHIQDKIYYNDRYNIRYENDLKDLRIKYLLNLISKEQWKQKLQTYEKKNKKERDYINIWRTIKLVLRNILMDINNETTREEIRGFMVITKNLRKFSNESFKRIGEGYNNIYPGISKLLIEIPNMKRYMQEK